MLFRSGNTSTALTGAQYTAIGITGVSGQAAPGNALGLLNNAVDAKPADGVDTVPELQTMANAAAAIIAGAAGGTAPTAEQLTAIGIVGVTPGSLAAIQQAIAGTPDDGTGVDSIGELQTITNNASFSTDHVSFDRVGLPGFQFIQDPLDYGTRLHHTHVDSFDHAIAEDMKQAAVVLATLVYNAAMADARLPRKPLPVEPTMAEKELEKKKAEKRTRSRDRKALGDLSDAAK